MLDDVAVDRTAAGDQDRHARPAAASGASHLLPGGRDRARIAGQNRDVELADVDAQFQGVGGDDAEQLSVAQAAFHGPTLGGQVPSPIAADPTARPIAEAERLAQSGEHQLHAHPRAAEDEGLAVGPQERQGPASGQRLRRTARAGGGIEERRLDHQDVALAGWGSVAVDQARLPAGERRRQLRRISDRGRAAHDHRVGAVVGADPEQSSQNVGHVAAEQPAVGVQLVDDDDAKLLEELEPFRVMGQDSGVEHVRVRDHHLAGRADRRPDRRRRVAVVGGSIDREPRGAAQLAQLRDLVLAQRLGGEEEESAGRGVLRQRLQRRHQVAQRLARGRGCDDDHVLAGPDRGERLGLMAVQSRDAAAGKTGDDSPIEPLRHRDKVGLPCGYRGAVDDAARQRRFGQNLGQHPLNPGPLVVAHRRTSKRTSVRIMTTV